MSFEIRRGETLGLVGESGSGKSTIGRLVMRLIDADAGVVRIGELNFPRFVEPACGQPANMCRWFSRIHLLRSIRGVVSDASLPTARLRMAFRRLRPWRVLGSFCRSLVSTPAAARRFPHEFSGGQRQRIGIARALALDPEVLVADEPVSALDVSVQAQVLALLEKLKERLRLAMLFITHDLNVAAQVCDRIAVMRLGEIVEIRPTADLLNRPEHPYTQALLAAIPGRQRGAPN